MGLLLVSLVALGVGPLLVFLAGRRRSTAVLLDSFVLVVVGGLIVLHVLPQSLAIGGWWALAAVGFGVLIPVLAERGLRPGGGSTGAIVALALVGLGLHAMIDGVALGDGGHSHVHADGTVHTEPGRGVTDPIVWAVILHRIPVGISIWWIVSRTLGAGIAALMLAVTMAGTVAGWALGTDWLSGASSIAIFQALLSGSLLHVVLHDHVPAPRDSAPRWHWASLVGLAGAVATLFVVDHDHATDVVVGEGGGHPHGAGDVALTLLLETAPVLLLAYLAVGFAQVFLPSGWVDRVNRGSPFGQALRGVAVGLPLPVCSCGVVPIYRGLVAKGASMSAAIAFLIATPELEIAAILLTFQLMGTELAIARLLCAAGLALVVGALLGSIAERGVVPESAGAVLESRPAGSLGQRFNAALRAGLCEAVDHTAAWILVGIGLSALLLPYVDPASVAQLPAGLDVPLAALIGLPVYVCASGSTPLAAILIYQGLSPGAALAFLLTGPATNVTTFGVLARLHGRRLAVYFSIAMLLGAVALGYLVNAVMSTVSVPLVLGDPHEHMQPFNVICLALFGGLVLFSMLRTSVRGFIGQLFLSPTREDDAATEHDHAHDHVHTADCH